MRFRNQSTYAKHPITQVMDKPLLRKKGKKWIVLSLSALALGGLSGALGLTKTNASALTEAQVKAHIQAQDKAHHKKVSPKNINKQAKALYNKMKNNKKSYQRKAGKKQVLVQVPKTQNKNKSQKRNKVTNKSNHKKVNTKKRTRKASNKKAIKKHNSKKANKIRRVRKHANHKNTIVNHKRTSRRTNKKTNKTYKKVLLESNSSRSHKKNKGKKNKNKSSKPKSRKTSNSKPKGSSSKPKSHNNNNKANDPNVPHTQAQLTAAAHSQSSINSGDSDGPITVNFMSNDGKRIIQKWVVSTDHNYDTSESYSDWQRNGLRGGSASGYEYITWPSGYSGYGNHAGEQVDMQQLLKHHHNRFKPDHFGHYVWDVMPKSEPSTNTKPQSTQVTMNIQYLDEDNNNISVGHAVVTGNQGQGFGDSNQIPSGYELAPGNNQSTGTIGSNGSTWDTYVVPRSSGSQSNNSNTQSNNPPQSNTSSNTSSPSTPSQSQEVSDTVHYSYNGNILSDAYTSVKGPQGATDTINPPKGYHFADGNSTESFQVEGDTNHVFPVAPNDATSTITVQYSDGQPSKTNTYSGTPGSSFNPSSWINSQVPSGSQVTSGNVNSDTYGNNETITVGRKNENETVHFNDGNKEISSTPESGKDGTTTTVSAPNGYHFANPSSDNVTLNGQDENKNIVGNTVSYKVNLTLNYKHDGKTVTKNATPTIQGTVGQNGTYIINPLTYANTNSSDAGYTPTQSDYGKIIHILYAPSNNSSSNITLNYNKGDAKTPTAPKATILPYNPGSNNPKIPKALLPNVSNDTIDFVNKAGKTVGTTKVAGTHNTPINIKILATPNNYTIAPNQSAIYNGGTHKILVDDIAPQASKINPNKQSGPLIIHNDAELDALKVGQSGLYNGHTVTKLSPNFLHWRYLWALQPYIVHSSFNSVSNPNKDRVERITPQMKRTYHIINIYAEKFGHITTLRYEIDYNGNGGKGYYVTGNKTYTDNSYYDQNGNYANKKATIQKPIYEYKNINHTYVKTLHPGDTVTIKGIKNISEHPYNLMTRFQIGDGNWVTANKNCVQFID